MTDSGSFDSGDLIYAADINNLNNLVNAKCALAGVAGSGVGSVSSSNTITAAHVNAIVAAYQRAWDASVNKPGTRQSAVSSGGLIYGALFQNMWTQLGQMTFDPWAGWNESSEASLAGGNIFVAFMENPTADGNEEGQGLGLSSPNTVLTREGTIAGATGSPPSRVFGGHPARFRIPAAMGSAFLTSSSGWTYIAKIAFTSSPSEICQFGVGGTEYIYFENRGNQVSVYFYSLARGVYPGEKYSSALSGYVSGTTYWYAVWFDGTTLRYGISTVRPTKLSNFGAIGSYTGACYLNTLSGTQSFMLGGDNIGGFAGTVRYAVAANRCLINNAA